MNEKKPSKMKMPVFASQTQELHDKNGEKFNLSEQNTLWKAIRTVVQKKRSI